MKRVFGQYVELVIFSEKKKSSASILIFLALLINLCYADCGRNMINVLKHMLKDRAKELIHLFNTKFNMCIFNSLRLLKIQIRHLWFIRKPLFPFKLFEDERVFAKLRCHRISITNVICMHNCISTMLPEPIEFKQERINANAIISQIEMSKMKRASTNMHSFSLHQISLQIDQWICKFSLHNNNASPWIIHSQDTCI